MNVIGVVGYKDSGKTTLVRRLSRALRQRGRCVAVIKHTAHRVDPPDKDTRLLREAAHQVAIISDRATGLFWDEPMSLEDALVYLEADLVVVEGFKRQQTYPKIACLRDEPDDADLFDGLIVAAVGPGTYVPPDVPCFEREAAEPLAELAEAVAFKLPALDCGACGYETCAELAREIVAGRAEVGDCVSLHPPQVQVTVDGRPLPMKGFVADMVRNTVLGLLSSLRGFRPGDVTIEIEGEA